MAQGRVVGEVEGDALGEEVIMDLAVRSIERHKAPAEEIA